MGGLLAASWFNQLSAGHQIRHSAEQGLLDLCLSGLPLLGGKLCVSRTILEKEFLLDLVPFSNSRIGLLPQGTALWEPSRNLKKYKLLLTSGDHKRVGASEHEHCLWKQQLQNTQLFRRSQDKGTSNSVDKASELY